MKVTWNWLAEFVELQLPVADVAEILTMAGLEVESIEESGRELADVVCAEIVRVRPHPNADRLSVCDVRTGAEATWTVVCGAANVQAGSRVAYAPPDATLPGGRPIDDGGGPRHHLRRHAVLRGRARHRRGELGNFASAG